MNIEILDTIPIGFIPLKNTNTQPKGTKWFWNKKSMFSREFKAILVKESEQ